MERCLSELVEKQPHLCNEFIEFHFANYGMAANHDWGFLWDHIASAVDFSGKRVIDLGCGMGAVGVFARLAGSVGVTSLDSMPLFLDAARHFASALRIAGNDYRQMDWARLANGSMAPPDGDIVTVLSARIDDMPLARVVGFLSRYSEILWRTSNAEAGKKSLAATGFQTIKTVMWEPDGGQIIYAADRVGK